MPYGQWKLQEARTVGRLYWSRGNLIVIPFGSTEYLLWDFQGPLQLLVGLLVGLRLLSTEPDVYGETLPRRSCKIGRVRWQEDVFLWISRI